MTLASVFDGWEGYNTSLVRAIRSLTPEQLAWRPAAGERSLGETAAHIALGRIDWFSRMGAPAAEAAAGDVASIAGPFGSLTDGTVAADAATLERLLERSWQMVAETLAEWTVDDLPVTYRQAYGGQVYAVSRQWVLFRILTHDTHHGGQIALMLASQNLSAPDLRDQGGHITDPPLAK